MSNDLIEFFLGAWTVLRPMLIMALFVGAFTVWFLIAESMITPKPTQLNGGE